MSKRLLLCWLLLILLGDLCYAQHSLNVTQVKQLLAKKGEACAVVIVESAVNRVVYINNYSMAVERRFPPGSIAKVWSAALLLEKSELFSFKPFQTYTCDGRYQVPTSIQLTESDKGIFNFQYDDDKSYLRCSLRRGHGSIGLHDALVKSCNSFFLHAAAIAPDRFYRNLISFWSLDRSCGLPGYREQVLRKKGTTLSFQTAAIGEGGSLLVSPLKVAQTFSALFSETPLLLANNNGQVVMDHVLPLSKVNRDFIYTALSEVLTRGTLAQLKSKRVELLAGKTGTATWQGRRYATHGWNVIYFKSQHRYYTLVVFVKKGSGPKEALQLSSEILNVL